MKELERILTLDQLVDELEKRAHFNSYLDIMKAIEIPSTDFEQFYNWNQEKYTRNCISKNREFELLLICYEKGQKTPIHDFDFQEAWIHPIKGRLLEERFRLSNNDNNLEKVGSVVLGTSEFSYMDQITIHRYSNIFDGRTVSLNLYIKPIVKWRVYQEGSHETSVVNVTYDSVFDRSEKASEIP